MTRFLVYLSQLVSSFLLPAGLVKADEIRPAFLQLTEIDPGFYNAYWKGPVLNAAQRLTLDIQFNDSVVALGDRQRSY